MLLDRPQIQTAYEQICRDAASAGGAISVSIFVSLNVDSISALRILGNLLKKDNVTYQVRPVRGMADMTEALSELTEEMKSLILINCGARKNVEKLLSDTCPLRNVYVIDSHRPVHLANIHSKKVIVFDDGMTVENWLSDGDDLSGPDDSSSESSSDSSDEETGSEAELELEDIAEPNRTTKLSNSDSENESEHSGSASVTTEKEEITNSEEDDDENETTKISDSNRRKRPREINEELSPEDRLIMENAFKKSDERKKKLREYYAYDSFGQASSLLMYDLSSRLGKDTNDLLWLAILGLTDQYVHSLIDKGTHFSLANELSSEVLLKNSDTGRTMRASDGTIVPTGERGRIAYDRELKFKLYRHWTLYESMFYSNYVASKMGVWTSMGKQRFEELLAKMGFSLSECNQSYEFMSGHLRKRLNKRLDTYGAEYGLEDVSYLSFQRFLGFSKPYSAADIVYSATALMEHRPIEEDDDYHWTQSFNDAFDALGGRCFNKLQRGLELSISIQKTIFQQAVSMIEKKSIIRTEGFRYGYIHAAEKDSHLLAQPCALSRLAFFLIDIHRENKQWTGSNSRPLLLLAERNSTYLVTGINCNDGEVDFTGSKFGTSFELAAVQMNAQVRLDGFERSIVEVAKQNVVRFVEMLFEIMEA